MKIILMDLDGVICDNSHRAHLVPPKDQQHRNEAWRPFVAEGGNDAPIEAGIAMLEIFAEAKTHGILVVTSRQQTFYTETYKWLNRYVKDAPEVIFRPDDCHLPPAEWKRRVVKHLQGLGYDLAFAVDDDPAIVEMYIAEGIPAYRAPGLCSSLK